MAIFTQEQRHINITTPLGDNKLLVLGLQGSEGISRLFNFDLLLFSEDQEIAFADIIGEGVTVSIELPSGGYRYFNGIVSSFSQTSGESASGDDSTRGSQYRATLVPKLWFLTRSADLKIFQRMTVQDIVKDVLEKFRITDYTINLQKNYEPREYCVQYRETHFNFISRLLEEEGIFYYFEHTDGKHRMIMSDSIQTCSNCPGQSDASYQIEGSTPEDDTISFIEKIQMIQAGEYMLRDYNFVTPGNSLEVKDPGGKDNIGPSQREIYDYPGGYTTLNPGKRLVRVRMEEEEAQITTIRGTGICRSFIPGYRFKLLNSDRKSMNDKEYILSAVTHTVSHSVQQGGAFNYENRFTCIPSEMPFAPPRVTPKPLVQGAQTAIVVGPGSDEIHTDVHGRVKVRFHWDREKKGEDSSCWIRVSQLWAGAGWGAMFIPRVGHEVIVDFLEGDPDYPIITGRVYHGNNKPPYDLPKEMTKSVIRSHTTPKGQTYNELLMEDLDKKTQVVLSNAYGHKLIEDEESQTFTLETRDKNTIIMDDKNKCITIQTTNAHKLLMDDKNGKILLTSTGAFKIEIDDPEKKMTAATKEGHTMVFDDKNKKIALTSKEGHTIVIDDDKKKMGVTSKAGHHITIDDSAKSITLEDSTGQHRFKIDIGGSKLLISTDSGGIDLKAAAGKILLDAMDVEIKGALTVKLAAGLSGEFDGGTMTKVKGIMSTVESSGITTIKGSMVMIN